MENQTDDIGVLNFYPERYARGTIINIHEVGRYTVIEFINEKNFPGKHVFASYVDGCPGVNFLSLEEALLWGMASGRSGEVNGDGTLVRGVVAACLRAIGY